MTTSRVCDYLLGGKDNFEPDRIAAEKVLALVPGLRRAAVENRRFLRRVADGACCQPGHVAASASAWLAL